MGFGAGLWEPILRWTLWGIVMALVMGWVAASRLRRRPTSDARRLVHPPSTLIIGLAGLVFFAGIAVLSNGYANRTTTWWTTATFTGFALLSVLLIADYVLARHQVSEDGLGYSRLTGRRGYLRWSELRRVRYVPAMKWFRLETASGDVARISVVLVGLPELASLLLAHAPATAVDADTASILQATAAGHPPSVWS
jgi:hypothetical protein